MLRLYRLKDYNFILVLVLAALSIFGILLVGSAEADLQMRQLFGVVAGILIMVVVSLFDYSWLLNMYWYIYAFNLVMLVMVRLFGNDVNGASRWIRIGGLVFQPTELSKILLIMFFAAYFMKHENDLSRFRTILKAMILLGLPLFMILTQPDLKNSITILLVFACMYYAAGLSYRKIGIILAVVIPLTAAMLFLITQTDLHIISDYQKERIMTFLEPNNDEYSESAMQQENSVMAIGSGGLTGKGLNNNEVSTANKGNFVAEIQTDFIFAVAGEELGFAGCISIVFLLFLIVVLCFRTGQYAKDLSGTLICTGTASLVGTQSFINICVASGILPNTGTPLPFVSYGLTSLISLYIGMGLVLNVGLQKKQYYEKELIIQ